MMVVADAILESSGRAGRLNPTDEALVDEKRERVIDRLERNRADLVPDDVGNHVRRDVRPIGNRSKHRQPLRGDLDAAPPQEFGRISMHAAV